MSVAEYVRADDALPRGPIATVDASAHLGAHAHPAAGWPKRAFDVAVSLTALIVLLPVLAVACLAVRLGSRGPIIFRQERVGVGGRPFQVLKLRTMRHGAGIAPHEDHVRRVLQGEPIEPARDDGLHKVVDESQLIPFGKVLRKLSIDELPQLVNVLKGDMSLVGPRPTLAVELMLCDDGQLQRLAVRPGMTGLWQVKGRNRLTLTEMFELDRSYVQSWSLPGDISILLRTVPAVLRCETS